MVTSIIVLRTGVVTGIVPSAIHEVGAGKHFREPEARELCTHAPHGAFVLPVVDG